MSTRFRKHWFLNLLGMTLVLCFLALSHWQYQRAQEKEQLLNHFQARKLAKPLTNQELRQTKDERFYRASLQGTFDHAHTILLDNRTYQGKIGYEVYTPFHIKNSNAVILVDRGFVPLSGRNRNSKPALNFPHKTMITGLLNLPPRYYAKGQMINDAALHPLIRVEFIDLGALSKLLHHPLMPYILQLSESDDAAYAITWQSSIMPKEKHLAYALQWFALSVTLLVLLVALNMRKKR